MKHIKILQWDVWYLEDIKNIAAFLKENKADIICLQELTIDFDKQNHLHTSARRNFLEKGLRPKLIRLRHPTEVWHEHEKRKGEIEEARREGKISASEEETMKDNLRHQVVADLLKIDNPGSIEAIVLTDEHDRNSLLEEGLELCGIDAERWLVGLDGSPAYYIG